MTRVYKFLPSIYIDKIVRDGEIRIASLSYYRRLEDRQWIADQSEGSVEINYKDPLIITGNELEEITPAYARPTIKVYPGSLIVTENIIHNFESPNIFVFCASSGDLGSLTRIMCCGEDRSYDGCIRIEYLERLVHRIKYKGRIVEHGNARVVDLFGEIIWDFVTYGSVLRDQSDGRPPPMGFLKREEFAAQSEVRIAFYPRQAISEEILTVKIPRPYHVFTEEFRNLQR